MIVIKFLTIFLTLKEIFCDIDFRYLDDTIDPCEDFYQFSCGNFAKYHERPENKTLVDIYTLTEDALLKIGKEILSSQKTGRDSISLKKAKTAYTSCVNVGNLDNLPYHECPERRIIEEFGGMPLINNSASEKLTFTEIGQIAAKFGVFQLFQLLSRPLGGENIFFIVPVSSTIPKLIRPRTVKTYDEILEEALKKLSEGKRKRLSRQEPIDVFLWKTAKHLLEVHGVYYKTDQELAKDLDDIKNFMAELFSTVENDNSNIFTVGGLQEWTWSKFGADSDVIWLEFLNEHLKLANINIDDNFFIYIPYFKKFENIVNLLTTSEPKIVKNFVLFRTFLHMAPDSDLFMRQAFEEYYKSEGLQYYNREDYCARKILDIVDGTSLSLALANEFVNYHFNINKIPEAVKIIKNIQDTFKSSVSTSDWIDTESRDFIAKKIDNIVISLGFPELVNFKSKIDEFYQNVRICQWDNYGNSYRIRAFKQAYLLRQYQVTTLWTNSPFQVNAFANMGSGRITAPISMLQSFFIKTGNLAFDYSRFGSILAHENLHHFDTSGINYDDQFSWISSSLLSPTTKENFDKRKQCLVDQYNNFYVDRINSYLNGSQTLNENLCDNGGLRHAFAAFKKIINNTESGDIKTGSYSLEQQFFINYATMWCSLESAEYLNKIVKENEHSPSKFRVIGTLSNMEEFAEAFQCPVGSKMNPEKKCILW